MLAINDFAPDISALADDGSTVTLSSLRGKPVVVYFYPRDNTPGCTIEACDFRNAFPRFDAAGATILGVSSDSVESHARFKRRFSLPFTLLADTDHRVAEAFGVWTEKSLFGKKYMGATRSTFIIDADGRIAYVFPKVKPIAHAAQVEAALTELRARRG